MLLVFLAIGAIRSTLLDIAGLRGGPSDRHLPIRPSSTREKFNVTKEANIEAVGAFIEQFRAPLDVIHLYIATLLFDGYPAVRKTARPSEMVQPCPTCGHETPQLLEESSRDARVNYYRCPHCGTVWNKPKHADGPIRIVAKYPPPPEKSS